MMISERHEKILAELGRRPDVTVRELASLLSVSEPTVRRDFTELARRGYITKFFGGARLCPGGADGEIPFLLRENEKSRVKVELGRRAAELVRDGMVVMLDGSTSAYHLVPYLAAYKDLIVITSGAKTALALAEAGIRTFCTGGQMRIASYSYVGKQAEDFVRGFRADILFFSCHGLDADGEMTDRSVEEANLRQVMLTRAEKKVLLCDSGKFGKRCFYSMGSARGLDCVISDVPLPFTLDREKEN